MGVLWGCNSATTGHSAQLKLRKGVTLGPPYLGVVGELGAGEKPCIPQKRTAIPNPSAPELIGSIPPSYSSPKVPFSAFSTSWISPGSPRCGSGRNHVPPNVVLLRRLAPVPPRNSPYGRAQRRLGGVHRRDSLRRGTSRVVPPNYFFEYPARLRMPGFVDALRFFPFL